MCSLFQYAPTIKSYHSVIINSLKNDVVSDSASFLLIPRRGCCLSLFPDSVQSSGSIQFFLFNLLQSVQAPQSFLVSQDSDTFEELWSIILQNVSFLCVFIVDKGRYVGKNTGEALCFSQGLASYQCLIIDPIKSYLLRHNSSDKYSLCISYVHKKYPQVEASLTLWVILLLLVH